jgi:hypothetical protein
MKKILTLCYALLFAISKDTKSSSETTIMAPTQGLPFLTLQDTGTPNTTGIFLGNNITIGDGTNPIILTANQNQNYPIIYPTDEFISLLGIDRSGRMQTATLSRLESPSKEVYSACNDIGIVTSAYNLVGVNSFVTLIGIDEFNFLTTAENKKTLLGSINKNNITIDNKEQNGITIDTSLGENNIILNSGTAGHINISGNAILTPTVGTYAYLGIDSNNNVITITDGPTPPGPVFTDLTATGQVSLGTVTAAQGATIFIPSNLLDPLLIESSHNIVLNGLTSKIAIFGQNILSDNSANIVLAIDPNNNLISSNETNIFTLGDPGKANIEINNITASTITLSGNVILNPQNFNLPGNGETVILTVNSQGELGILLSSKEYKENIEKTIFNEESKKEFDDIIAYSYNYRGDQKKKIGLIAEEVAKSKYWADTLVIRNTEGDPYTIDYHSFFTACYARFCDFKDQVKKEKIKNEEKNNIIKKELSALQKEIIQLQEEIIKLKKDLIIRN